MCVCVCVCALFKCSHQEPLARTMGRDKFLYLSNNLSLNYLFIYIYIYLCVCVKFSLGHTIWFSPFFWISHWAFCPKWMAIRVCKRCRNRAAKLKWQYIWCVQENGAALIVGWCYPLSQNLLQTKVLSVQIFWVLTVGRPNFGKFLRF